MATRKRTQARKASRAKSRSGVTRSGRTRSSVTRSGRTRSSATHSKASRRTRPASTRRWSQRVTEGSDALDLKEGVFTRKDPKSIARSLKQSAEASHRRKSDPYRSAMSMLTFYINRAGEQLPSSRRKTLESAKRELRRLYDRE